MSVIRLARNQVLSNAPPSFDGLVGWWPFDAFDATDASGFQNNGTLTASPTFADTPFGSAVVLNGTSQDVRVGTSATINTSPLTYAAWINSAGAGGSNGQAIFGATGPAGPVIRINASDSKLHFLKAATADMGNSTVTISTGVPTHVAVTYNNPAVSFYINGVLSGTGSSSQTFSFSTLAIGSSNGGSIDWFNGKIGDARVYNRALSAQEINSLYNRMIARPALSPDEWEMPALFVSIVPPPPPAVSHDCVTLMGIGG